ncbi:hypothetical protein MLD38_024930 [Melastoma candidum]|uniref:Uncharacterized protein n=1 Tax=Melastoma candidum TaxID=119954 RepID=A0ACB9NVE8_9MYRT|nr:hypothetical protein MLD38_024930 [Melastoma candidum]
MATPLQLHFYHLLHHRHHRPSQTTPRCTAPSTPEPEPQPDPSLAGPSPASLSTIPSSAFPLAKRRPSLIVRPSGPTLPATRPEPPNLEIGWKRTKPIPLEKPKGYVIADFLDKLQGLMEKEFGTKELLAKAGEIVAMRAKEEAEVLREKGEVEERLITELLRVLRLLEMDFVMVKGAVKEETVAERVEQAKARCRQAILVANSF